MTDTSTFLREWFDRLAESGWTAEVFLAALSPDLVWTATGSSPISGTYRGLEASTARWTSGLSRGRARRSNG
jgi:ketosteroid isomerase-like protein